MKTKITILVSLISLTIFSQNIKGIVLDKNTNKAIPSAHINYESATVAITNKKGEFQLTLEAKNTNTNHISISHVGYTTLKVQLSENEKLTVYLSPDNTALNEVVLSSKKKLNKSIRYTEKASLRRGLHEFAAAIHDDKIVLVGGKNNHTTNAAASASEITSLQIEPSFDDFMNRMSLMVSGYKESHSGKFMTYDLNNDVWETSDLRFRKRAAHNLHVYDNEIYVMGGKRLSGNNIYLDDVVEVYDTKTNLIQEDTPNPHQAVNFASFQYGDYLIFMGGIKKISKRGKREYTKDIHFYNLKSGYWYKLGEMPKAKETKGVLVNDVIYLIGGFNKRPLKTIESFDLKTGKWHTEGELFKGIERPAVATRGNIIYIYNQGRISTYNTTSKELNEYVIDLQIEAAELLYHDDQLYLLGGYTQTGAYTNPSRKVYSIDLAEFSKTKIRNSKKTQRKTNS